MSPDDFNRQSKFRKQAINVVESKEKLSPDKNDRSECDFDTSEISIKDDRCKLQEMQSAKTNANKPESPKVYSGSLFGD